MGFALFTGVLSIGTVTGMVAFTGASIAGLGKVKLGVLEKYESLFMGALLSLVGLLIILFET